MAHTKLFTFNLFFVMMLSAILAIVPGQGFSADLHLSWGGFTLLTWTNVGAFDIVLDPTSGVLAMIVLVVALMVTVALVTTKVAGSGVDMPPFKILTLMIGVGFVGVLCGMQVYLTSALPVIFQFILVFPPQILMLYSLIMDLGLK